MSEREILFRGKRVDNGEWIEGYFLPGNERQSLHPCIFVYLPETQSFECFDIDIDTLGEYTSLTDKNGTRIFEGDIIKISNAYDECDYIISEVYGFNGVLCVDCPTADYDFNALGFLDDDNEFIFEVIGNIHDNGHPF